MRTASAATAAATAAINGGGNPQVRNAGGLTLEEYEDRARIDDNSDNERAEGGGGGGGRDNRGRTRNKSSALGEIANIVVAQNTQNS